MSVLLKFLYTLCAGQIIGEKNTYSIRTPVTVECDPFNGNPHFLSNTSDKRFKFYLISSSSIFCLRQLLTINYVNKITYLLTLLLTYLLCAA